MGQDGTETIQSKVLHQRILLLLIMMQQATVRILSQKAEQYVSNFLIGVGLFSQIHEIILVLTLKVKGT